MSKTMLFSALAAGLGAALAAEFLPQYLPEGVATMGGGAVAKYGVPVAGAWAGLFALSFVK